MQARPLTHRRIDSREDRFDEVIAILTPVLTNAGVSFFVSLSFSLSFLVGLEGFSQAATVFVPVDGLTNQVDAKKAATRELQHFLVSLHGQLIN